MQEYYIQTKEKSCFPFDEWITKLEMRAFGWCYKGIDVEYENKFDIEIDWERGEGTARQRSHVYTTFKRIRPYTRNILFILLEAIMTIQSWIRRKLIYLLFGITALLLIIGTITTISNEAFSQELGAALIILAVIYVPSLITLTLGYLTRVIFGIDRKLKKNLVKNGYAEDQDL